MQGTASSVSSAYLVRNTGDLPELMQSVEEVPCHDASYQFAQLSLSRHDLTTWSSLSPKVLVLGRLVECNQEGRSGRKLQIVGCLQPNLLPSAAPSLISARVVSAAPL